MNQHSYNVRVTWTEERKGILCSDDVVSSSNQQGCIEVATPPQFPKGVEGIWSPEHLYTASVASCFMTTFLAVAENSALAFSDFECEADGILEFQEGKPLMTEVILRPTITVANSDNTARAQRVLAKSEKACLITNSIRAVVSVVPTIRIAERIS